MKFQISLWPPPAWMAWVVGLWVGCGVGGIAERWWPGDHMVPTTWGEAVGTVAFSLLGVGPLLLGLVPLHRRLRLLKKGQGVAEKALQHPEEP